MAFLARLGLHSRTSVVAHLWHYPPCQSHLSGLRSPLPEENRRTNKRMKVGSLSTLTNSSTSQPASSLSTTQTDKGKRHLQLSAPLSRNSFFWTNKGTECLGRVRIWDRIQRPYKGSARRTNAAVRRLKWTDLNVFNPGFEIMGL